MRIVVCSHRLEIGGSQTNAIDLAWALASRGHEVTLFASDGPARDLVKKRELDLVMAPERAGTVSVASAVALCRLVRMRQPDLVHAYEWPQCLDAFYGPHLFLGTPIVFSILSMTVPRWLPKQIPLVVGTSQLEHELAPRWHAPVVAIEPPIDTDADDPETLERSTLREELGLPDTCVHIVIVSRLVEAMKLEGIRRAIEAAQILAGSADIHLTVVGDGPARSSLDSLAKQVNAETGQQVVTILGPMLDPRPAYASADVVLGMGSSALRAMSFGKPVIVLGERGFSQPLTGATLARFVWTGFYGFGSGDASPHELAAQIKDLITDREERQRLGVLGRKLVLERFSLHQAARRLEEFYRSALSLRPGRPRTWASACLPTAHLAVSLSLPEAIKNGLSRLLPRRLQPPPHPWEVR
jgi:glycosyltransferase involved in cell wall biosynthesis